MAAAIANHAFNIAFIITAAKSPKLVFKQVMALQFPERLGTLAFAIDQYLGHRNPGVVVQDRLRHPTQKNKSRLMLNILLSFAQFEREVTVSAFATRSRLASVRRCGWVAYRRSAMISKIVD